MSTRRRQAVAPSRAARAGRSVDRRPSPAAAADPPQDRPGDFESLLRATAAIGASRTMRDVAEILRAQVARILAGDDRRTDVYLGRAGAMRLFPEANARKADLKPAGGDALVEKALQRRRPLSPSRGDRQARLVLPLVSRREPWGYVDVRARRLKLPGTEETAYLQVLADTAATVLENAYLRRSTSVRSVTDSLTGYYSRWYFYDRLYSETARARRYCQPLSAVVFEIDDFEEFVKQRGEAAGTYLLRAVSRLFRGSLRDKVDLPYRCGGARFALLLPNTPCSWEGAALVAERLRSMLEVTDFRNDDDEVLGRFTLSAGVAGFPSQCDDADELAAAAEHALRAARRAGKNAVRVYRE